MEEMLAKFDVSLTKEQLESFDAYYDLLVTWNGFMNLTGITEYGEVLLKHFVDSLSINSVIALDKCEKLSIIDIGTGAGFPGLPIKIAFPKHNVTLLDSLNKRINFLNEVIKYTINNKNEQNAGITAIHGRAEETAIKEEYRQKYDLAVSRAVANLSTLSEYCLPFVKAGGSFIAYKSGDYEEELNNAKRAFKLLGAELDRVHSFILPGSDIRRSLIVIRKLSETPKKYPRKAGLPSKEPL